jgi:hypothetical protein
MSTKRTPIKRPLRPRITAQAISTFRAMNKTVCTCPPPSVTEGVAGGVQPRCHGCEEWFRLHSILHRELGCRPWEYPCVQHPDTEGAKADAVARWRELEAAARGDRSPWDRRAEVISKLEQGKSVIHLDDDEMSAVLEVCRPLPPPSRDQFLRLLAAELERHPEIGPGLIHRIARDLQRQYLNPPRVA